MRVPFEIRNAHSLNPPFRRRIFIAKLDMETARSIIESVTASAVNGTLPEKLRVTLLEAATKLVVALQKPEDAITKLAYQVLRLISTCDTHADYH